MRSCDILNKIKLYCNILKHCTMDDYFQEMRRRELGDAPNTLRIGRYLIDIDLFENNFVGDWSRERKPACQEAIKNLTTVVIQSEGKDCSICLVDFKKNDVVKSMPCQHLFHEQCILTWLNQNNTCPFCRHKLPARLH